MDITLQEVIRGQLRGAATRQIGDLVVLDEKRTESALGAVVAVVLGGFAQQASTSSGLGRLGRVLDTADDTLFDDVVGLLGGDTSGLVDGGGKLAGWLFDGREDEVAAAVGREAGIDARTAAKLLNIVVPLVTAWIARRKRTKRLDERAVADLFGNERSRIEDTLPGEVRDTLGMGGDRAGELDFEVSPERPPREETPSRAAAPAHTPTAKKGCNRGCLLPGLILVVLLFLGWKMCSKPKPQVDPDSTTPSPERDTGRERSPGRGAAKASDAFAKAVQQVDEVLLSARSLADVRAAVPVLEGSTAALERTRRAFDSLSMRERRDIQRAATALPKRIKRWVEHIADIPGAGDLVGPSLLAFGEEVDKLAAAD